MSVSCVFIGEGFVRITVGLKRSGAKKYARNRPLLLPAVRLSGESCCEGEVPGISEEAVGRVDLSVGLGR